MDTDSTQKNIKTVLELDLVSYSDIARTLEENLDAQAVKAFEDQIQSFVDDGLKHMGLCREDVVHGSSGDNAILIFDDAATMHKFSEYVHRLTRDHNRKKSVESAKRWFRMGAATGTVLVMEPERRIVGTTIARAVRLEAAAKKGELLVDIPTFDALPAELRNTYGEEEVIHGKRNERFTARRYVIIPASELIARNQQAKAPRSVIFLAAIAILMSSFALIAVVLYTIFSPDLMDPHVTKAISVVFQYDGARLDRDFDVVYRVSGRRHTTVASGGEAMLKVAGQQQSIDEIRVDLPCYEQQTTGPFELADGAIIIKLRKVKSPIPDPIPPFAYPDPKYVIPSQEWPSEATITAYAEKSNPEEFVFEYVNDADELVHLLLFNYARFARGDDPWRTMYADHCEGPKKFSGFQETSGLFAIIVMNADMTSTEYIGTVDMYAKKLTKLRITRKNAHYDGEFK